MIVVKFVRLQFRWPVQARSVASLIVAVSLSSLPVTFSFKEIPHYKKNEACFIMNRF